MDEFKEAVEVIAGRYYVAFLNHEDSPRYSAVAAGALTYCIDQALIYEPFYADFGPLNMGKMHRFCEHTKQLLKEADRQGKKLYLYTGPTQQAKANAAVLVGIFQVLYLNRTPDEAYAPLAGCGPYMPFRDASCGAPTFNLQPLDCIRGVARARDAGFLDASGGAWRFDLAEYEHYEAVENGDLNWIVPGKLVAFSGPAARPTDYVCFRAMTPEDYWEYFGARGVRAVVRLNKRVYDRRRFLDGGFEHHELYFPDGSCPTQDILLRFLDVAERTPGALAVHCKAGLGRTGVLICAYIMKHYRFTAEEVLGYIRVCRPGSVIGPQQGFVKDIQPIMWAEGDVWRARHGPAPPPLAWGLPPLVPTAAAPSGKAAAAAPAAVSLTADSTAAARTQAQQAQLQQQLAQQVQQLATPPQQAPTHQRRESATELGRQLGELTLAQLHERIATVAAAPAAAARPSSAVRSASSGRAAGSGVAPQQLFGSSGPLAAALAARPATGRTSTTTTTSSSSSSSAARERPSSASSGRESLSALLSSSLASLRASLNADSASSSSASTRSSRAAAPAVSQSADVSSTGWRVPPVAAAGRPSSAVARVLAPNGQPRKMPAAALAALVQQQQQPSSPAAKSPPTPQQQQQQAVARLAAYYTSSSPK